MLFADSGIFIPKLRHAPAPHAPPAHAALAFCFRPPRHAQVIFCKAARAAIAPPPAPPRLCPTRQHLRLTRRRPSIFPAHFRKIAPFPGMLRPLAAFLARIYCITPFPCKKRGVFSFPAPANSAFSPCRAIFSHACRPAEARSPQQTTTARKKAYA